MVTVLAKSHQALVWKDLEECRRGHVVFQPENRDTAAGIFLPLTYVRARNPHAIIVVFPSDHFVFPESQFMAQIQTAALAAGRWGERVILLGIAPTSLELDYGWIEPGESLGWIQGMELRAVNRFVEKPTVQQGVEVIANGGMWSTLILTAQVETLWSMGWRCFPDLMNYFEMLFEVIGTPHEGRVLKAIYRDMPRYNFSSILLQREIERIGVMELQEVVWSDWGRPERIIETLQSIGSVPRFPINNFNESCDSSCVQPSARRLINENTKTHSV
jgi:mannose-1-phosphate guanylyltransferase